jgi:Chaperone of endosialidase
MASSYSTNLRIELIGTGDQSGTWGNTTNTNLGTLIEQAITGYQLVTATVSPSYLQASNGAVDEARNMVVALATSTGAAFNVAIPPREKVYVFVNTSSYAATIYAATGLNVTTSAGGTTVTIPAGRSMMVYCDGAPGNVKEAINHTSSLTLSTPLATASGGTGSSSTQYCALGTNVSGTLPTANGGTGQTTYTNGQLLIGNTTGNTLAKATLTGTANQITVTNGAGSITLSTPQNLGTASDVQFGSIGVGTAASGAPGEIRATDNVTAYYSSDRKFKENVREIPNALDIVSSVGGKLFTWSEEYVQSRGGEDGYFIQKEDFGVVAQDVQAVFPAAVRTRPDGSLAVDYAKLSAIAFAAIVELRVEIDKLKGQ